MAGNGDSAGKPMWVQLALEEYRVIRAEILTTMQTQHAALTFGTAALGILAAGGFNVWKDDALAATLVFLIVAPFLCALVLVIWMGEIVRMMRAGRHVQEVEVRFAREYPDLLEHPPVMRWETNLRDPKATPTRWRQHYEWNYTAIVLMFSFIAIASIGLGVYRGTHGGLPLGDGGVWAIGAVFFLANAVVVLLVFRKLAIVCRTQGFLKYLAQDAIDRQPKPDIPRLPGDEPTSKEEAPPESAPGAARLSRR